MTDSNLLQMKREEIINSISNKVGSKLIRKTRALYQSADHQKRVACTISKRYEVGSTYWYAYHPKWDEFLKGGSENFFVLGCMDLSKAFAIPRNSIYSILDYLHMSENEKIRYWHIHVTEREEGNFELVIPKRRNIPLDEYEVAL